MAISTKVKIPTNICIINDFKSSKSDMIDYDENLNLPHFNNTPINIQISNDTITNKTKIVDPRGFSCFVNNEDIINIMMETTIVNGIIKDQCVWVIDQRYRVYPVIFNGDTHKKIIKTINDSLILDNNLITFKEVPLFSSVSRPKDRYLFDKDKQLTYIGQYGCNSRFNLIVECTNTFKTISVFDNTIQTLMYNLSEYDSKITVTFNDIKRNSKNKTLSIYRYNKDAVVQQFKSVNKSNSVVNCTFTLTIDTMVYNCNKSYYFYNETYKSVVGGYESYSNSKSFLIGDNSKVSINANNVDLIMDKYYTNLTKQKLTKTSKQIILAFTKNIYYYNNSDEINYKVITDRLNVNVTNYIFKNNLKKFLKD